MTWNKLVDPVGDEVLGVTDAQDGFVAVGHRADSAAAWSVSAEGVDWQRIAGVAELGPGVPIDVVSVPSGLIVVGISLAEGVERPAVWKSSEGTWERTDFDTFADDVPLFGSIAVLNSGLAIVGRGGDSGGDSAILVSRDGDQWERGRGTNPQIQSTLRSIVGFRGHFVVVGNDFDREAQIWTTIGEADR